MAHVRSATTFMCDLALRFHGHLMRLTAYGRKLYEVGGLYRPANAKRHPMSPSGTNQKRAKHVDRTHLSWLNFSVSLTIS